MSSILFNLFFNSIYSLPKKRVFHLVTMLFASINPALAEDSVPDKFSITIGGYSVFRYDATMSLTHPDPGAGILISPEDTPGLDNKQTVLRLMGHYRFTKKHALTYSWYRISSQGNKMIEKEFEWLDENNGPVTIPLGANVDSSIDYNIFKVAYLWSFHHTNKVEMAVGAGLHVTRFTVDLHSMS